MQRFARASQFTRGGSSPSVTYCTSRPRMCFVSARRFSTRNSCRSVSSTGTIRVLEVKRQPQYRGECRRSRTFSSSIARTASLPVGDTRKVSCASDASVSAQDWIAARRSEVRRSVGPQHSVGLRSTFSRSPSPTRCPSRHAEPLSDLRRRRPGAVLRS